MYDVMNDGISVDRAVGLGAVVSRRESRYGGYAQGKDHQRRQKDGDPLDQNGLQGILRSVGGTACGTVVGVDDEFHGFVTCLSRRYRSWESDVYA